MSLCKECFTAVRHEGTPEGKRETIAGVDTYIATPAGDYPKDKILLFLPDAFGFGLENNLLLTDDFARNGYKTVFIDYFLGDPAPLNALDPGSTFSFQDWIDRHPPSEVLKITLKVINALRAEGVTKFATTGYCYGGRTGFDLAFAGEVDVVTTAHPSLLKIPEDLLKYAEVAKAPLLINSCEVDSMFPISAQEEADKILGGGKFAPGYERTYWPGCVHGFAVKGDISIPEVKAGMEGAFKATIEFLQKYWV
ncbi:alpha/beta-hydrolase [Fomes fomentarius]|nr:alpha/beta-hydrolase [Fomes fomentarius]